MLRFSLGVGLWFGSALLGWGQQCPQHVGSGPGVESVPETLTGSLIYHNGIRQWFELKLDTKSCEQTSLQLVEEKGTELEQFRGCRVEATGPLSYSGTGYIRWTSIRT